MARQRRPGRMAAGSMLLALAILTNVYLFRSASDRVSVVRLARDVPVGQQIGHADVDIARVAVDSAVATLPGHQLEQVVGKRAAVGLHAGTLLTASQLMTKAVLARGQALVTVPLKSSAMPPGLAPGWRVRVVFASRGHGPGAETTSGSADSPALVLGEAPAVVDQVSAPGADGAARVSLLVPEAGSNAVARQAAAEQVALVVTERRG